MNKDQLSALAFRIAVVADVILLVFIVVIVAGAFPLQFTNPVWLTSFAQSLLDNGGNALLGLLLLTFALYLDSENSQLSAHFRFCANLACLAVIGYLLLIPLQGISSIQLYNQVVQQDLLRYDSAIARIGRFESEVRAADGYDKLSAALKAFQGVSITTADRQRPFPQTKQVLLYKIKEAKKTIAENKKPELVPRKAFNIIQSTIRNWILSIGYVVGFSALAQRPSSTTTLLQELYALLFNHLDNRLRQREETLLAIQEDEDFLAKEPLESQVSSFSRLSELNQQGVMDHRWLPEEQQTESSADQLVSEQQTPYFGESAGASGAGKKSFLATLAQWMPFRKRLDNSTVDYLDQLAIDSEQHDSSQHDQVAASNPASSSRPHPTTPAEDAPARNPLGRAQRSYADSDYFESLSRQQDQPKDES